MCDDYCRTHAVYVRTPTGAAGSGQSLGWLPRASSQQLPVLCKRAHQRQCKSKALDAPAPLGRTPRSRLSTCLPYSASLYTTASPCAFLAPRPPGPMSSLADEASRCTRPSRCAGKKQGKEKKIKKKGYSSQAARPKRAPRRSPCNKIFTTTLGPANLKRLCALHLLDLAMH